MDSYVEEFQAKGGSLVMLAKGNRSKQVTEACKKHGGFYLGSIGGPAAVLAKEHIKKVELLEYPELGMEAIYRIEVSPLNGVSPERLSNLPGVRNLTHSPKDGFAILEMILAADDALGEVVSMMTADNIRILNLQKREPTLEDVFVELVGRSMEEVESAE